MFDDTQVSVKSTRSALYVSISNDELSRLLTTLQILQKNVCEIRRSCLALDRYAVGYSGVAFPVLVDCSRPTFSGSLTATSISDTVSQEGILA